MPPAKKPTSGCGGNGCLARDTWPLHQVRHRGVLSRLCTSCVLKCHPGSFCCHCFSVLDPSVPPPPLVACSTCPSVSHLPCLPNPNDASRFACPSCSHDGGGFSFFRLKDERGRKRIDLSSARVLLAAARISAASMSRAAAAARGEAERKVKEAAVARKRAREMLERAVAVARSERERMPKKKRKKKPGREVDKWIRFHEIGSNVGDAKGSHKILNVKEGANRELPKEKKRKKGSGSGSRAEEKGRAAGVSETGPKLPTTTQDALNSRTNSRVVFSGSTTITSLCS